MANQEILLTDEFMLQRMSVDGTPYMRYDGADLMHYVESASIKINDEVAGNLTGLEIRVKQLEDGFLSYTNSNNLAIQQLQQEVSGAISVNDLQNIKLDSLETQLNQYINQDRGFGTFDYTKDSTVGRGEIYFSDTTFVNTHEITISKFDRYGKFFSYNNITLGETLELRSYYNVADIDKPNQIPDARVLYTIKGIMDRDASNNPIRFIVEAQTVFGAINDGMVIIAEIFPNFDPDLKADVSFVSKEVEKLEEKIVENKDKIENDGVPTGCIISYFGNEAPPRGDWLLCDGSSFDKVKNPLLFDLLGNNFTPNLDGMYLVQGGKFDISRTVKLENDAKGDKFLKQSTAFPSGAGKEFKTNTKSHSHDYNTESGMGAGTGSGQNVLRPNSSSAGGGRTTITQPTKSTSLNFSVEGGDDYTRPNSVVIRWIIKGG